LHLKTTWLEHLNILAMLLSSKKSFPTFDG
jgi:hypothetical protein